MSDADAPLPVDDWIGEDMDAADLTLGTLVEERLLAGLARGREVAAAYDDSGHREHDEDDEIDLPAEIGREREAAGE